MIRKILTTHKNLRQIHRKIPMALRPRHPKRTHRQKQIKKQIESRRPKQKREQTHRQRMAINLTAKADRKRTGKFPAILSLTYRNPLHCSRPQILPQRNSLPLKQRQLTKGTARRKRRLTEKTMPGRKLHPTIQKKMSGRRRLRPNHISPG